MKYIKASPLLFILSLILAAIGSLANEPNYSLIIVGLILNCTGIVLLITGVVKENKAES